MAGIEKELKALTFDDLRAAVAGQAAAIRIVTKLAPAGGPTDKVFPATYEGGQYASERRLVGGIEVETVLLDSVQSQANRMELALRSAWERRELKFPLLVVDFSQHLPDIGRITALDAPHRVADAILRDSLFDGKPFRESPLGQKFTKARVTNATPLFDLCPTALIFGVWDSSGPRGGGGAKFARAIVSEIVAYHAVTGLRTSSRIDPLQIRAEAGPLFEDAAGGWTLDESNAKRDEKGKPVMVGGAEGHGRPSVVLHGNVTPSIARDDRGNQLPGGVTIAYALQTTVLSLAGLRRLRFPADSQTSDQATRDREIVARTLLAALALAAIAYQREEGYDLRSRCLLVPSEPSHYELVPAEGGPARGFTLTTAEARVLFDITVKHARDAQMLWREDAIRLLPTQRLVDLVRRSEALAGATS
jgi:CRISPR-associated protein Csb1